jgi:hypothetical protein
MGVDANGTSSRPLETTAHNAPDPEIRRPVSRPAPQPAPVDTADTIERGSSQGGSHRVQPRQHQRPPATFLKGQPSMIISPAPATTATVYNTITGESRTVPQVQADHLARNSRGEWSMKKPLAPGWDKEIPKDRVEVDLHPSVYARHRTEPPFTSTTDSTMFQYANRDLHVPSNLNYPGSS